MALLRPIAVALATTLTLSVPIAPPVGPAAVEVADATSAQTRVVHDMIDAFHRAGLAVPPVIVTFHRRPHDCGGALGRQSSGRGVDRIDICVAPGAPPAVVRRAVAHELAHTYLERGTDPAVQAAFVRARGLRAWQDAADPWSDRGVEHAAEVLAWALARPPILFLSIPNKDCRSLIAAFRVLVGHAPPDPDQCPVF